MTTRKFE